MDMEQAVAAVEQLIAAHSSTPAGWTCCIEFWRGEAGGDTVFGVRIAEISTVSPDKRAGSSWMQCEPGALGVIAAAERAIIERTILHDAMAPSERDDQQSEIADADWRLTTLLDGE